MPKLQYKPYRPTGDSAALIIKANEILDDYAEQGFQLTLRQLYYQFVARDLIPNTQKSYNNLGKVISRAREAGLIDWDHITDRGRQVVMRPHWIDGEDFLESVANQFCLSYWLGQQTHCEVWVEKDALSDIAVQAARPWDVPVLANKGYISASAIWEAAHTRFLRSGQPRWVVIHLGDHDPSGIDMSRDIQDRLNLFSGPYEGSPRRPDIVVKRVALNMDQIEEYAPPPNFAKEVDPRFRDYQELYGDESWELDALEPRVLVNLIRDAIQEVIDDMDRFEERRREEVKIRAQLRMVDLRDYDTGEFNEHYGDDDDDDR